MLTKTWRTRLTTTGTFMRRGALAVGISSCTIVAAATIWGWITDKPIDVAGPARSAVNRTALIGSYAQDCVSRWLTATVGNQQSLHDCWSLRDAHPLPTNPAVVITSPNVSAVTLVNDFGQIQQWSVVVSVSERPYLSATPHTAFYRLPVIYSNFGVRANALPARVNGPGPGADAPLGYGVTLDSTSPAYTTVAGFITSYLTSAGGLERYVTTGSGLLPAADYRATPPDKAPRVTKLVADHSIPDVKSPMPADGTTVHVLATVTALTQQYAPVQFDYPITLTVTSGRWTVAGLDYAPLLADDPELTPVIPTATTPR